MPIAPGHLDLPGVGLCAGVIQVGQVERGELVVEDGHQRLVRAELGFGDVDAAEQVQRLKVECLNGCPVVEKAQAQSFGFGIRQHAVVLQEQAEVPAGQQEAECIGIEHGVKSGPAQGNTGVAFTQECLHFSQSAID